MYILYSHIYISNLLIPDSFDLPALPEIHNFNKKYLLRSGIFYLPMAGVEPARSCLHQILSLARLPIPSHRRIKFSKFIFLYQLYRAALTLIIKPAQASHRHIKFSKSNLLPLAGWEREQPFLSRMAKVTDAGEGSTRQGNSHASNQIKTETKLNFKCSLC